MGGLVVVAVAATVSAAGLWLTARHRTGRTRWRRLVSGSGVALTSPGPVHRRLGRPVRAAGLGVSSLAVRAWREPRLRWCGPTVTGVAGALGGLLLAGPMAAGVLAAYGIAGFIVLRAAAARRAATRAGRLAADAVAVLSADLRAGITVAAALRETELALDRAAAIIPPTAAGLANRSARDPVAVVAGRIGSVAVVAQASGAPFAEVLDRLDAHLRAADRAHAAAQAHAAGARGSAALLAALPVVGVALGSAIGFAPTRVLLHTAVGGFALAAAVVLQLAGVAWAGWLARVEVIG